LKGRYTFFVFNEVYLSYLSNVYHTCSFFTNLDPFCIDNARVIYKKIQYFFLSDTTKIYLCAQSFSVTWPS